MDVRLVLNILYGHTFLTPRKHHVKIPTAVAVSFFTFAEGLKVGGEFDLLTISQEDMTS